MTCQKCKFFKRSQPNGGLCHRYPPAVLFGVDAGENHFEQHFPYMENSEWCGEFKRPEGL